MASIDPLIKQDHVKAIEDYATAIIKLNDNVEKLLQTSVDLDKKIGKQTGLKNTTQRQKEHNKTVSEAQKLQKQFEQTQKKREVASGNYARALTKETELLKKTKKEEQLLAKERIAATGSIAKMKAETAKLQHELEQINRTTKEGRKLFAAKKKQIDANNKAINKATGRYQGLGRAIKGFGTQLLGALGITAGITALLGFSKSLVTTATALEQTDKRARIVFGESFPQVERAAASVAKQMGLTSSEFIKAATNTGDLLIPLDFTREQSADLSVELQSLAGALDEWSGGTLGAAEVSNILTKAVLGENEQLKQLGIAIRQDSEEFRDLVKQKQADEGVTKAQARALATLELIQKKSADAQAAYTQGGGALLRFQKAATLEWKRIKEGIAEFLVPAKSATQLFKEQQTLIRGLEKTLQPLIDEYEDLSVKTDLSNEEQNRLNVLIGQIAKQAPAAITEVDRYGNVLGISAVKAQEFVDAQKLLLQQRNREAIEEQTEALSDLEARQGLVNSKLEKGTKIIETWAEGTAGGAKKVATQVPLTTEEISELNTELISLGGQIKVVDNAIKILSGEPIIDTGEDGTGGVDTVTNSLGSLKDELKKLKEARDKINIADTLSLAINQQQIDSLKTQIDEVESLGRIEIDRVESITAKKIEANEKLINDEERTAEAIDTIRGGLDEADKERITARAEFVREIGNFGIDTFNAIQDNKIARLENDRIRELELAEGNAEAQDKINEKFDRKQAALKRKQAIADKAQGLFNIAINTAIGITKAIPNVPLMIFAAAIGAIQAAVVAARPIPEFFKGTDDAPGGPAWVAEKGPEIEIGPTGDVTLLKKKHIRNVRKHSQIIPNAETQQILHQAKGYDSLEIMQLAGVIRDGDQKIIKAIKNKKELTIIPSKGKLQERGTNYTKTYFNAKVKF